MRLAAYYLKRAAAAVTRYTRSRVANSSGVGGKSRGSIVNGGGV